LPEHVLVTGGAGFIGQRLAKRLLAEGNTIRVLDCLLPEVHGPRADVPPWLRSAADVRVADVRDPATVRDALSGVTVVVHLAAATATAQSMFEMQRTTDLNVTGTAVLCDGISAGREPIRKLVVASSRAVYGEGLYRCSRCGPVHPGPRTGRALGDARWEPPCPSCGGSIASVPTPESSATAPSSVYGVTKLAQELLARATGAAFGVPVVALRFQNVYGGGQSLTNPYTGLLTHFYRRLTDHQPPLLFEDGRQSRDFVHVDDTVDALMKAIEGPASGVFNVGSGRATTIADVARLMSDVMAPDIVPVVCGESRLGDIRHCVADLAHARAVLSYVPQVPLEAGLREFIAWAGGMSAFPNQKPDALTES
jgi:dTDP-L-rhamnose 4-epimerase